MSSFLTTAQVAERLGVSVRTVMRLINRGDLAAEKIGPGTAPYLFNPSDVERLAQKRHAA